MEILDDEVWPEPIEIIAAADYENEWQWGNAVLDENGDEVYDEDGFNKIDPYNLTGYTITASIKGEGQQLDFTVDTADLSGGWVGISLTNTQTALLSGWKTTNKDPETIGFYRIYFEDPSGNIKVWQKGEVDINTKGL